MKKRISVHSGYGATALLAVFAIPALVAQEQATAPEHEQHHRRYKVIDTGSFGGPNSHMSLGAHILNNSGMFTGYADTAEPDPYAPDGCWDSDCLIAHTFRWKNGQLTDLGVLDGGPNSESNWISENGFIAGDSQNGLLDPNGGWEIRGVLWKHDKIIEVGTLGGGIESLARAVNGSGEVVGLSTTAAADPNAMIFNFGLPFPFQTRAFRWKDGVIQDLGTLGGTDAMALGINERGQIIGNSYTDLNPSSACSFPGFTAFTTGGFLWDKGEMMNLGSLGGTCTNVSAINDRGQVVGSSFLAGDQALHPFRWENGKLTDLGVQGNFGIATLLNETGDVAGWQTPAGNDNLVHATLWSRGHIVDLGALGPDNCSVPFGINSKKQVAGVVALNCNFGDDLSLRAFLWEPGRSMLDLNTLISPNLGIQLRNVATINERGEMAAVASFSNGDHRPVLLIPCAREGWDSDDCQDTTTLNTKSIIPPANPLPLAPATWANSSPTAAPNPVRALLSHRYRTYGVGTAKH